MKVVEQFDLPNSIKEIIIMIQDKQYKITNKKRAFHKQSHKINIAMRGFYVILEIFNE